MKTASQKTRNTIIILSVLFSLFLTPVAFSARVNFHLGEPITVTEWTPPEVKCSGETPEDGVWQGEDGQTLSKKEVWEELKNMAFQCNPLKCQVSADGDINVSCGFRKTPNGGGKMWGEKYSIYTKVE